MHDAPQSADGGRETAGPALKPAPPRAAFIPTGRQLRIAIVVPAVCLALVLILRLWLQWVGPLPGDRWALTRNDYGNQARWVLDLGNFFQVAGTPVVSVITIAWAAVFVRRSEGLRGLAFLMIASLGVLFNSVLKAISGTTPLMAEHVPGALNFPSGHTVYSVVVFGSLAWMALQRGRREIAAGLVFLIVLMGPFRVSLGAHMASDVIAAYFAGVAWLVPAAIVTGYGSRRARTAGG